MKNKAWAAAALITAAAWSISAQASTVHLGFSGQGVSGDLVLTYQPDPNTGPIGTQPNAFDPVGASVITGVTGTFWDTNAGLNINGATVTGLVAINPKTPQDPVNLLAPHSFSIFSSGVTYDDLFYLGGSPPAATNYPFGGGVFDIYGVMFQLSDGHYVDLYSNGVAPPDFSLNYGVAVTSADKRLDQVDGLHVAPVPEPASWAMMVVGIGGIGGALRLRKKAKTALV
jgi:hypothetical protein